MKVTHRDLFLSAELEFVTDKKEGFVYIKVDKVIIEDDELEIHFAKNAWTFENQIMEAISEKWRAKYVSIYYDAQALNFHQYRDFFRELYSE